MKRPGAGRQSRDGFDRVVSDAVAAERLNKHIHMAAAVQKRLGERDGRAGVRDGLSGTLGCGSGRGEPVRLPAGELGEHGRTRAVGASDMRDCSFMPAGTEPRDAMGSKMSKRRSSENAGDDSGSG
eukprot:CAMPEP_0174839620 /NCGR_PEP_ID=MMETSP1114-20130205/8163_1 /TAXON_ID=312471 /ORGANISM="Neobodo designis, Strain CCAP 1951/1" /LENGTH=125 /DNA_ID=CAMNT_0016073747 /DNA_START=681 /DNA_END=1055 /DNA_ORIENTATION=-